MQSECWHKLNSPAPTARLTNPCRAFAKLLFPPHRLRHLRRDTQELECIPALIHDGAPEVVGPEIERELGRDLREQLGEGRCPTRKGTEKAVVQRGGLLPRCPNSSKDYPDPNPVRHEDCELTESVASVTRFGLARKTGSRYAVEWDSATGFWILADVMRHRVRPAVFAN